MSNCIQFIQSNHQMVTQIACLLHLFTLEGLPRRLSFSCVSAAQVPVASAVGALLPCLWQRMRCDVCVVSWLDACAAAWLGGYCSWLVQHRRPALVGWRLSCVCAFGGCSSS